MATTTTTATKQTMWECRWSRPGLRLADVDEAHQPEPMLVCVRTGTRRQIPESRCETCPFWEPDPGRIN